MRRRIWDQELSYCLGLCTAWKLWKNLQRQTSNDCRL